jgi:hypothetical protein
MDPNPKNSFGSTTLPQSTMEDAELLRSRGFALYKIGAGSFLELDPGLHQSNAAPPH